jgi:hypothetical protein
VEGDRASFDMVGAPDRPIVHGGPGGAEKQKPSRRGSVFPGKCEMRLGEGKGGSNGGGYNGFGCSWRTPSSDHSWAGGAEKRKPSCQGSVFPGRCGTRLGEGGGGFNGGGYNGFGCGWCTQYARGGRGLLIPVNQ